MLGALSNPRHGNAKPVLERRRVQVMVCQADSSICLPDTGFRSCSAIIILYENVHNSESSDFLSLLIRKASTEQTLCLFCEWRSHPNVR